MSYVIRYTIVLVLLVFGSTLLYYNRVMPPLHIVVASGGAVLLAGLIADPNDLKTAIETLMGAWRSSKPSDDGHGVG